ncbi:MAG: hypothetical protein WAV76_01125 [Bacteroidota bacterium]
MKTKYCFLTLFLLALACKSNPVADNSQTVTLIGKWLWTETSGGLAPTILKPSADQRDIIQFTADSNFYTYGNDTLIRSTHYSIRKGNTNDTLSWQDKPSYRQVIRVLTKDSLLLCDPGADGFNWAYTKVLQ